MNRPADVGPSIAIAPDQLALRVGGVTRWRDACPIDGRSTSWPKAIVTATAFVPRV